MQEKSDAAARTLFVGAVIGFLALCAFQAVLRQVRLVGAAPDRVGHAQPNGPGRVTVGEQLIEDRPETRDAAGAGDDSGETARAKHLGPAKSARQITGVHSHVGQSLTGRERDAGLGTGDAGTSAREIGAVSECSGYSAVQVDGDHASIEGGHTGSPLDIEEPRADLAYAPNAL